MKRLLFLLAILAMAGSAGAATLRQVQQGVLTFTAANTAAVKHDTIEIVDYDTIKTAITLKDSLVIRGQKGSRKTLFWKPNGTSELDGGKNEVFKNLNLLFTGETPSGTTYLFYAAAGTAGADTFYNCLISTNGNYASGCRGMTFKKTQHTTNPPIVFNQCEIDSMYFNSLTATDSTLADSLLIEYCTLNKVQWNLSPGTEIKYSIWNGASATVGFASNDGGVNIHHNYLNARNISGLVWFGVYSNAPKPLLNMRIYKNFFDSSTHVALETDQFQNSLVGFNRFVNSTGPGAIYNHNVTGAQSFNVKIYNNNINASSGKISWVVKSTGESQSYNIGIYRNTFAGAGTVQMDSVLTDTMRFCVFDNATNTNTFIPATPATYQPYVTDTLLGRAKISYQLDSIYDFQRRGAPLGVYSTATDSTAFAGSTKYLQYTWPAGSVAATAFKVRDSISLDLWHKDPVACDSTIIYGDVSTNKTDWTLNFTTSKYKAGSVDSLAFTSLTGATKYYFRLRSNPSGLTSGTDTTGTDSATTTASGPTITVQPASVSLVRNTSAAFSVTATGTGTLHYQWAKKLQAGAFGNVGTDANSYSYTATTDFDSVKVTVTDDGGSLASNTVYTHIYPQYTTTVTNSTPAGTLSPANGTVLDSNTAQALSYTAPAHYKKDPYTGTAGVHFNADSTTYYLTANGTITAVCHDIRKTLTVTTVGSGTSTGAGTYDSATSGISISNSAAAGWGWKGPWTKTGGVTIANANVNPTTITITADGSVTATDTATYVYSNITVAAIGGGSTTPSEAQSVQCLHNLNIAATDAVGHHFTEWKYSPNVSVAAPTSASTTCATTDSAAGTVTAWFDTTRYSLTMAMTAGGAISPAVGAHTYDSAATVPIVGTNPKTWYAWSKWTRSTTSAVVADTSLESTSLVIKGNSTVTGNWTLLTAATPTLVKPANNDTAVSTSCGFFWNLMAADSAYILLVSKHSNFSDTAFLDTTTDTTKIHTLDTATNHYYKARGKNNGGLSVYSTAWTFKTARASSSAGGIIIGGAVIAIGIGLGFGMFRRKR
jgi:hypothetical protein